MNILKIKGAVQHYAWGGKQYIPELLNIENTDNQPFAELWMGTHPRGTATLEDYDHDLKKQIAQSPENYLGIKVARQFDDSLPFLFKILDVNQMLSIQTHPTKEQAEIGFQKENEAGVPIDAKDRNFKDNNHKPEIMVALTDFWLLHGFRSVEAIQEQLTTIEAFAPLKAHFKDQNIRSLYQHIMELPQMEVNDLLAPLQRRLQAEQPSDKSNADYWAHLAFQDYTREGNYDRGIFSIYLFNLVKIKPDDAIFQEAGIPHAYLEGVNVELMANSDNVFRGGLTPKHIDVPELMKHLNAEAVTPKVFSGTSISEHETVYRTPAPDFEVSRIELDKYETYRHKSDAPDILIVLEGKVKVSTNKDQFMREKGEQFFVAYGTNYEVKAEEKTTLFRATVPN